MTDIKGKLFSAQDEQYKKFHCGLMPTVNPDTVIGVRMPHLRRIAKEIKNEAEEFIAVLPHKYYEENNLHGILVGDIKDFDKCIFEINRFLPYINNWATCDMISPKVFKKNPERLMEHIRVWMKSEHTYTVRFAVGMLMKFYLDENFKTEYLDMAAETESDEYYIKMMVAWYFATALAKQYEKALPYISEGRLEIWTHNKTIQKAIESFRITDEQKKLLRKMKR